MLLKTATTFVKQACVHFAVKHRVCALFMKEMLALSFYLLTRTQTFMCMLLSLATLDDCSVFHFVD